MGFDKIEEKNNLIVERKGRVKFYTLPFSDWGRFFFRKRTVPNQKFVIDFLKMLLYNMFQKTQIGETNGKKDKQQLTNISKIYGFNLLFK